MAFVRPLSQRTGLHRALLCLLLLGVLLHGHAGVLRQLLGAAHWHAPAGPAALARPALADWLAQALAWRADLQARSPLVGGHATPGHHHGGSERHHHDRHDTTVVVLEPATDSADTPDARAGSLLQPLGLAGLLHWTGAAPASARWARACAAAWRDANHRQPERPPRA